MFLLNLNKFENNNKLFHCFIATTFDHKQFHYLNIHELLLYMYNVYVKLQDQILSQFYRESQIKMCVCIELVQLNY